MGGGLVKCKETTVHSVWNSWRQSRQCVADTYVYVINQKHSEKRVQFCLFGLLKSLHDEETRDPVNIERDVCIR